MKATYLKVDEIKWRSNWHFTIAKFLESKPLLFNPDNNVYNKSPLKKGAAPSSVLLSDTQVEHFFGGYHYL